MIDQLVLSVLSSVMPTRISSSAVLPAATLMLRSVRARMSRSLT
jgi:hypothetical protein